MESWSSNAAYFLWPIVAALVSSVNLNSNICLLHQKLLTFWETDLWKSLSYKYAALRLPGMTTRHVQLLPAPWSLSQGGRFFLWQANCLVCGIGIRVSCHNIIIRSVVPTQGYLHVNQAGDSEEKGMQMYVCLGTTWCPHQEYSPQSGRAVRQLLNRLLFSEEGKLRAQTEW